MAWELWPFPRSMSRSRLVLLVLSLGAGSFVSTCLLLLFILRAVRFPCVHSLFRVVDQFDRDDDGDNESVIPPIWKMAEIC